jgi:hypothetical protein
MSKCGIASLCLLNTKKSIEYIPSIFDIQYSIFDICLLIGERCKEEVSISIKPAALTEICKTDI